MLKENKILKEFTVQDLTKKMHIERVTQSDFNEVLENSVIA